MSQLASWPMAPLERLVLETQYGTSSKANDAGRGQPIIRMNNLTYEGNFDISDLKWVELADNEREKLVLHQGDLLFNRTNSRELVGKTGVWNGPEGYTFAGYLIRVRLRQDIVLPRWVAAFMNSPEGKKTLFNMAKPSINMANISASDLLRLYIPVAPIEHQKKTIAILDKADAIRRKRKQAIALTDQLLRSTFLEMFGDPVTNPKGWPEASVGSVADVQGGLQVTHARENNPISVPYLRVANVFRDKIELTEIKQIRITESEMARAILQNGDVLVVEGHGNPDELGRAAVWRAQIDPCTHQNHLIRVRPKPGIIDSHYLCSYLNSNAGRQQMLRFGNTTSGLNTISTNNVRSVSIAVPPTNLQKRFAVFVNQLNKVLKQHRTAESETQALFSSLVDRAFSGDLSQTEQVAGQLSMFNK